MVFDDDNIEHSYIESNIGKILQIKKGILDEEHTKNNYIDSNIDKIEKRNPRGDPSDSL